MVDYLADAPTLHKASPSSLPEAIKLLSGEKVTENTILVCPVKVLTKEPSDTLHILMVSSNFQKQLNFHLVKR